MLVRIVQLSGNFLGDYSNMSPVFSECSINLSSGIRYICRQMPELLKTIPYFLLKHRNEAAH